MFIPRVYYAHDLSTGQRVLLNKDMAHYLATVLRLKNHDHLFIFNGQGGEYSATFFQENKKAYIIVADFHPEKHPAKLPLHLGQGICRGDRMDYVIQKATELGVTEITPLFTHHSLVKMDPDRQRTRHQHWMNIAISAAEQSGRTDVPAIFAPTTLESWIGDPFAGRSLVFDWQGNSLKSLSCASAFRLAIGPESGWTETELNKMAKSGFERYHLGPRILRTETAPIVALSLLQGWFGDIA